MNKQVKVGKFALESLTTGMYNDPFIVFREYIQNSADGIDDAVSQGVITYEDSYIRVMLDSKDNRIIIEDNGIGISQSNALNILTNIGNSKKSYFNHKGFRGIGRLAGLTYCDKLIFETSLVGENVKSVITFNAQRLRELLIPGKYDSHGMTEVINEITSVEIKEEESTKHYFSVIMENIKSKYKLLELEAVEEYIKQVAPIEFDLAKFKFAKGLYESLNSMSLYEPSYNVYLGKYPQKMKKILKPYKTKFYADMSKKILDNVTGLQVREIRNDYTGKTIALVWYGKCELLGTILDSQIKGLRLRKSGLLIGDRFTLNSLFKEDRFNGWVQGEVLVFDEDIIPNARRDDFEQNEAYMYLIEKLKDVAEEISNEIRETSKIRNKNKVINAKEESDISNNRLRSVNDLQRNELINKVDHLIEKSNIYKETLIEKIRNVLNEELNSQKAEMVIEKIEKLIS